MSIVVEKDTDNTYEVTPIPMVNIQPPRRRNRSRGRHSAPGHRMNLRRSRFPSTMILSKILCEAIDSFHLTDKSLLRSIMVVLQKHERMYFGSWDTVRATHHRIDLLPGLKPSHQRPYCAGPKTRSIIYSHLQTQFDAALIEPA